MFIQSAGMVCASGFDVASACAAMRASIARFEELPYLDSQGEAIIGACVPELDSKLDRPERLVEMLSVALADCLAGVAKLQTEKVPLLVGLAEPERPGGGADLGITLLTRIQDKLGLKFHPKLSRAIASGHTSGFDGLRFARELLRSPQIPYCLVCATDSYLHADSLRWLEQAQRLKTPSHSDGIIPGEAAAALLISAARGERTAEILGLGFGEEKSSILSEKPLLGLGLTDAVRDALSDAGLQLHHMNCRFSDVTGEQYGFKEQSLMVSRLLRQRPRELPIIHAADRIGDTGAAAGLIHLIMARQGFLKGYGPGTRAIACGSAVGGARAAAVIQSEIHGKPGAGSSA